MEEKTVIDATIYQTLWGSRAYGTHTPSSDYDKRGVCILPDSRYYYGFSRFEQKDKGWADGEDRVIFDIRKFFELALKCNPNIIEMLYVDEGDIIHIDALGQQLRDNRGIFLSQRALGTFVGYALSQLHRIKGHFKWLSDAPVEPKEEDFTQDFMVGSGGWHKTFAGHRLDIQEGAVIRHFNGEEFKAAQKKWQQYQKWLRDRNPARAAIEAEYGYDCKHAYHLIRLLRMGKEILSEGKVVVRRPDAKELLEIRHGKFKYLELIEYAQELKAEVDAAAKTSDLPKHPDQEKAEKLLMSLIAQKLGDPK